MNLKRFTWTGLSLPLCILACVEAPEPPENQGPTASILAPENGDSLLAGETTTAWGNVSDPDDAKSSLSTRWFYGEAEICPSTPADEAGRTSCSFVTVDSTTSIRLEVTDPDGAVASDSIVIETRTETNTLPVITEVNLAPGILYTDDILTATVSTQDADEDPITLSYAWYVNGEKASETSNTLSGDADFNKDDSIYVEVTPNDGEDDGATVQSDSITVQNSAPTTPEISIDPSTAFAELNDLICRVDTASEDADEDPIAYAFSWKKNSETWTGETKTTVNDGDTIDKGYTSSNDEWICTVIPSDESVDGVAAASTIVIEPKGWVSLSAGASHACAIDTLGAIDCWGSDSQGQATPPSGAFKEISVAGNQSCGIDTNDAISCWGATERLGSATEPTSTFSVVDLGDWHACAIDLNGSIECWGTDMGDGNISPPTGTYTQLSVGARHTCAVDSSGLVACWGDNSYAQSSPPTDTFIAVSAGSWFTCGIRSDQSIDCWGDNADHAAPAADSNDAITGSFQVISAGSYQSCGLQTDGTVTCWGCNGGDYGQCQDPSGSYDALSTGNWNTCAINTDREIECWGRDDDGQSSPPSP